MENGVHQARGKSVHTGLVPEEHPPLVPHLARKSLEPTLLVRDSAIVDLVSDLQEHFRHVEGTVDAVVSVGMFEGLCHLHSVVEEQLDVVHWDAVETSQIAEFQGLDLVVHVLGQIERLLLLLARIANSIVAHEVLVEFGLFLLAIELGLLVRHHHVVLDYVANGVEVTLDLDKAIALLKALFA